MERGVTQGPPPRKFFGKTGAGHGIRIRDIQLGKVLHDLASADAAVSHGAGTFTRTFGVPPTVDGTRVEAKLEQGVLTVVLPKREDAKPRIIDVQVRA